MKLYESYINDKIEIFDDVKIVKPFGYATVEDDEIYNFFGSTGFVKEILTDGGRTIYYIKLDKIIKIGDYEISGEYFTLEFLKKINK